jgi:enamine deaminase RidA (YjgF/YER057c/UK114 family)
MQPKETSRMEIERINPDGLFELEAFTQVVTAGGGGRIAFIAGQGAFDADFNLVGPGDLHAQTVQAFRNLRTAVEAIGGSVDQVVSSTMYIVGLDAQKVETFGRAMAEALDGKPFPPNASTMVGVQSLAMEGMLVEISAVAVIP